MKNASQLILFVFWFFVSAVTLSLSFNAMAASLGALDFDGIDDYIQTAGVTIPAGGNAYTVEFWFYMENQTVSDQEVVSQWTAANSTNSFFLGFVNNDNIRFSDDWNDIDIGVWATGKWHHIAAVSTADNAYIYLGGVLKATKGSALTYTGTGPLVLGKQGESNNKYFDGKIDEVRAWNTARSATELRNNMARALAGDEAGLISYYNFDENAGTTLSDITATNNHGTLTNMDAGTDWVSSTAFNTWLGNSTDWNATTNWSLGQLPVSQDNAGIYNATNDPVITTTPVSKGNALTFAEDSDYVISTNTINIGNTFTVSFWMKPALSNSLGDPVTFGTTDYRLTFIVYADGSVNFITGNGVVWGDEAHSAAGMVVANTWYHIVGVSDGTNIKLYVDGTLAAAATSGNTVNDKLVVGGRIFQNYWFKGQVDDVRVWSDPQDVDAVKRSAYKSLNGDESGLLLHYDFNENLGTSLPDNRTNTNNGILTNMAGSEWAASLSTTRGAELNNLIIGSSTAITLNSALSINSNLILEDNFNLNGQVITLGESASLIEDAGLLSGTTGYITTTRILNNISSEDVAGLGATITSAANLGSTTISRSHGAEISPVSINRQYQISPASNTGLNATLVFNYGDSELNGLTEAGLALFKSADSSSWTEQSSSINTANNQLTLSGMDGFSYLTAAITNINDAGSIIIDNTTPAQGNTLTATVTDADGATGSINYQWKSSGANVGTNSNTYTTVQSDVGNTITVTATYTDDLGSSETPTSSATSAVTNVNDAPTISDTPAISVAEDVAYSFTPTGADVDAGETTTLVYSITNKPDWATFSTSTGALTGTPDNSHVGITAGIVISVKDINDATASLASFDLEVTNVDDAPEVSSVIADLTVNEDATDSIVNLVSVFTDIDNDDTAIVKSVQSNDNASLVTVTITGDNLTLVYAANVNGVANITIRGTSNGKTVDDTFEVTVLPIDDNPEFSSTAVLTVNEDAVYSYGVTANDDGDSLTITATNIPDWLALTDNGDGTAALVGTPENNDVGTHTISLKVSDSNLFNYQNFIITVVNTNDAPTVKSNEITVATEDVVYSYTLIGDEVDAGDTFTYSTVTDLSSSWLSFNANTGVLSGMPFNTDVGIHNVELRVTDAGGLNVNQSFSIEVFNINDTLTVDSVEISTATEGIAYSYTLQSSDIDIGDLITSSVVTKPDWLSFAPVTSVVSDGATVDSGVLTGTPTNADVGVHNVTLRVTDDTSPVHQTFIITVENINDVPVISGTPNTSVDEDALYEFTPTVVDPDDGDTQTFTISGKPSWASFDTVTGTLTGTPENTDVGDYTDIIITVDDSSGAVDSLTAFSINVGNINDAPTFDSVASMSGNEGVLYSYSIFVSDVDTGDNLTLTATQLPSWLNFDGANQLLSGTPAQSDIEIHSVTLRVNDGSVNVDQTFEIEVFATNSAPTITSTASTTATEDTQYTYTATVSDTDDANNGVDLTWSLSNAPTGMSVSSTCLLITFLPSAVA